MADVVEGPQRAVSESGGGRRSGDGTVFTRTRFFFLQKKIIASSSVPLDTAEDPLRVLRLSQQNQQPVNTEPQRVSLLHSLVAFLQ